MISATGSVALAALVSLQTASLALLGVFAAHRLLLLLQYLRCRGRDVLPRALPAQPLPSVTIQLPLYNEPRVVERLIHHAAAIRYPKNRLEIQVLDDSTDETSGIAARLCAAYRAQGTRITHIRRKHRIGFKAGALAEGLSQSDSALVAIFDADFLPHPDFLEKTVPHFDDSSIAMVQIRWSHLNAHESLLAGAQAMLLDGHFQIEHTVRSRRGLFFNFNGTAGIWRASAIREAGGWQGDTLTEDLDLSYRAQLRGMKLRYLAGETAPGELPDDVRSFRAQQYRWTKGAIEVLRKLGQEIVLAPLPLRIKTEALLHLGGGLCYPLMLLLGLTILPLLAVSELDLPGTHAAQGVVRWFFGGALVSLSLFYLTAAFDAQTFRPRAALLRLLPAMALGMGISLSNSVAVLHALIGMKTPFERTPKAGFSGSRAPSARTGPVPRSGGRRLAALEAAAAVYFAGSAGYAAWAGRWDALPLLVLYLAGFSWISSGFLRSLAPSRRILAKTTAQPSGAAT